MDNNNKPLEINGPAMIQMLVDNILQNHLLAVDTRQELYKIMDLAHRTSKYMIAREEDKTVTWSKIKS